MNANDALGALSIKAGLIALVEAVRKMDPASPEVAYTTMLMAACWEQDPEGRREYADEGGFRAVAAKKLATFEARQIVAISDAIERTAATMRDVRRLLDEKRKGV